MTVGVKRPLAPRHRGMLIFSVGGRQVAARTEEISAVRSWPKGIPVPSDTPFVSTVVRLEDDCLPVYDLAARLNRTVDTDGALCLVVKHEDGPMAICIDSTIPSLVMAETITIQEGTGRDADISGSCTVGDERFSVIRLARLGKDHRSEQLPGPCVRK
jgi:chemotaxis signal transduction protein